MRGSYLVLAVWDRDVISRDDSLGTFKAAVPSYFLAKIVRLQDKRF